MDIASGYPRVKIGIMSVADGRLDLVNALVDFDTPPKRRGHET